MVKIVDGINRIVGELCLALFSTELNVLHGVLTTDS